MNRNFIFRNSSEGLPRLLDELLRRGDEVGSRAGRVKEMTHVGITLLDPLERELLVPDRNPNIVAQIAETAWILSGRNDIGWLSHYLPRAKDFSDNGKSWRAGYGPRIREWPDQWVKGVDQLEYVVRTLLESPLSRQAVISIWDPVVDTEPGKDIPCNDWLTFLNRNGELDLHVGIRSNDAIWGWSGINAFEWSVLLEIVAGMVGVNVGKLHFSTTSFHLYEHHWERAGRIARAAESKEPVSRRLSPRFSVAAMTASSSFGDGPVAALDNLLKGWFETERRIRETAEDVGVEIRTFPEPMLKSWLQVLAWWWRRDESFLNEMPDCDLKTAALHYSVQPKHGVLVGHLAGVPVKTEPEPEPVRSPFILAACELHREKDAAYGDSWKKRGELVSILANIARKADRLGGAETSDETSADTAMDFMIYLAKYLLWLEDTGNGPNPSTAKMTCEDYVEVNERLLKIDDLYGPKARITNVSAAEEVLKKQFEFLFELASEDRPRWTTVHQMLGMSYELARVLWEKEQDGEEPYRPLSSQSLSDLLSLVGVVRTADTVSRWNETDRRAAEKWASMEHLAASDNDVTVPAKPSFLQDDDKYRGADRD